MERLLAVKVGGDFACFTRPEFKVERVSYPVMTPSAARGLLEAVCWKPEMRWEVREIWLLKPVRQVALLRNEIADRQGNTPFFIEERRQQRASLILRDVEYIIRAAIVLRSHATDPVEKYAEQFRRRLERGQCHHAPYLGTREFAAWFESVNGDETPEQVDLSIGPMLFDIAYREAPARPEIAFNRHSGQGRREVQGYAEALFFDAHVQRGILTVPTELYQQLYALEEGDAA
jgi:CRISPR-associated protein Cas5d